MKNLNITVVCRFGNFIIQLKNAIKIALFYNYNVIVPKHDFFNTTYIVINEEVTIENEKINNIFFFREQIDFIDDFSLFDKNDEKMIEILKKIFILNDTFDLGSNDLVIHIRGGDLFTNMNIDRTCPMYVVPPLSYYINIIENNNFDVIYLISEDLLNPCVNKLLELYPNIIFNIQLLKQDIELILSAPNIVVSYGTFVPQILTFSSKCKKCFFPSYFNSYINNVKSIPINLDNYRKLIYPWKNTKEKYDLILSYKL